MAFTYIIPFITVIFHFIILLFSFIFIMVDNEIIKYENNIAKILERAVNLFKETDLTDLAEKWDRILKNYYRKKTFS